MRALGLLHMWAAALVFSVAASLNRNNVQLRTCRHGVGLAPFLKLRDSRSNLNAINCADGGPLTTRGVHVNDDPLVAFEATLRSLSHGVGRQGFELSGLNWDRRIALVGVCVSDSAPLTSSSLDAALMPQNMCAGVQQAAGKGSPRLEPYLDDTRSAHLGWQIRNGPQPNVDWNGAWGIESTGTYPSPVTGDRPCNFYGVQENMFAEGGCGCGTFYGGVGWFGLYEGCDARCCYALEDSGLFHDTRSSKCDRSGIVGAMVQQTGLGDFVGLGPIGTRGPGCTRAWFDGADWSSSQAIRVAPALQPTSADDVKVQHYGSLSAVLQSWSKQPLAMLAVPADCCTWQICDCCPCVSLKPSLNAWRPYTALQPVDYCGCGVFYMCDLYRNQVARGVMSYAGFSAAQDSAIGFQLACDVADVDETKWVTFTFLSASAGASLPAPPGVNWATYDYPYAPNPTFTGTFFYHSPGSYPDQSQEMTQQSVDSQLSIKVVCQNVATDTPTPPLYPRAPAPAPWDAPSPLAAGATNSFAVVARSCTRLCKDVARQRALAVLVGQVALQNRNVGASTYVDCLQTSKCTEETGTTSLGGLQRPFVSDTLDVYLGKSLVRRGLRQATSTAWLQVVTIVTRELATAQYIADQIRSGTLSEYINPFAALSILGVDGEGEVSPQTVAPPSSSAPIANWPSPLASWTGSCTVYGTCRAGGCASGCANRDIEKVTGHSDANILCYCNNCNTVAGPLSRTQTHYFFQTSDCGSSTSQQQASECCRNVAQDVVCWALQNSEVSPVDKDSIKDGRWSYRSPSIGLVGPAPVKTDGPGSCPPSSSSSKGLLGLLGLLGIIPLALCLLSLLLCLLRRKKREGDVHFATFDAGAVAAGATSDFAVAPPLAPVGAF